MTFAEPDAALEGLALLVNAGVAGGKLGKN